VPPVADVRRVPRSAGRGYLRRRGHRDLAATVATVQNDIKRVIAYSTCSQLGYMFFAAGVGAYGAAMFHLFTHAFFKALLFLGAGSVIHAMHHEQDMRFYGALRKRFR
jgi:NADH-quinone oxidoreductase subunit L